jgi:hypothetical protein
MKKTIVFTVAFAMVLALSAGMMFATTTMTTGNEGIPVFASSTAVSNDQQTAQTTLAAGTVFTAAQAGVAISGSETELTGAENSPANDREQIIYVTVPSINQVAIVTAMASTNLAPTSIIRSVNYIIAMEKAFKVLRV